MKIFHMKLKANMNAKIIWMKREIEYRILIESSTYQVDNLIEIRKCVKNIILKKLPKKSIKNLSLK